jgi:uncharacterized protein (DUF1697 family)
MTTYIALLRGINVGGHKLIKMELLRNKLTSVGFTEVKTYIQSGNIVFRNPKAEISFLENRIKEAILEEFGFEVPVLVRDAEKLVKVYNENPFLATENIDISNLHVTLLTSMPLGENMVTKMGENNGDKYIIIEDTAYLMLHNKYNETKLSNSFFEKKWKVNTTTRNWKTIIELVKLCDNLG